MELRGEKNLCSKEKLWSIEQIFGQKKKIELPWPSFWSKKCTNELKQDCNIAYVKGWISKAKEQETIPWSITTIFATKLHMLHK